MKCKYYFLGGCASGGVLPDECVSPSPDVVANVKLCRKCMREKAMGVSGAWGLCEKCASPGVVGDNGLNEMTMEEIISGLKYISDSPAQEHGGFHPTTIKIAKAAKELIINQHAEIMRWIKKYNSMVSH